jgi:hypothetical protein
MARGQPINVEVSVTAEVGAGLPDTATAAALEVSTQYSAPALLNHSVRSYLWVAPTPRLTASTSTRSCSA